MTEADSYADYDSVLNHPTRTIVSPWMPTTGGGPDYVPDYELLEQLLAIPITAGVTPETGRFVNALDVWIADELRRAGFGEHSVWPRRRQPRVADPAIANLEERLLSIEQEIEDKETRRPARGNDAVSAETDLCGSKEPAREDARACPRPLLPQAGGCPHCGRGTRARADRVLEDDGQRLWEEHTEVPTESLDEYPERG